MKAWDTEWLCHAMCNGMFTETARDLVYQERKLDHFLILTGVLVIASPIISLLWTCRRLCHPRIKQNVAAIAPVDVTVSK